MVPLVKEQVDGIEMCMVLKVRIVVAPEAVGSVIGGRLSRASLVCCFMICMEITCVNSFCENGFSSTIKICTLLCMLYFKNIYKKIK